jgi:hypothetical protein
MKSHRILIVPLTAVVLACSGLSLWAEDWKTTDGKAYQNVEVIATRPDMVTIVHDDGVSMVPLENLPADLQKRFNYDPAKAKAFTEERAKVYAANARALQAEMTQAAKLNQAADGTGTDSTPVDETGTTSTAAVSTGGAHYSMDSLTASLHALGPDPADSSHHSIDDVTGSLHTLRHDLSDPSYSTTAHVAYNIQSQGLGPDPSDKTHHTMNEISASGL